MNRFSYYITTHFIPSNKDYNFCCNFNLVYQMYRKRFADGEYFIFIGQHLDRLLKADNLFHTTWMTYI